ncbi:MAG: sigma-70 family RNA polymerase sigma factor [Bacteroidales bacterium]|nr:sigma-70 family RNA polymerase sigma factor [Bacteroidales bacterium]
MDLNEKERLFSDIYKSFRGKIYRICYGYIYEKEQVDDLFQEIMINIWNSIDRFRGESQIGTWIYKVAVNTALIHNKKTKTYQRVKVSLYESNSADSTESEDYRAKEEQLNKLALCISKLDKEDRLIITMILEDLSYEQVSEIVGISPNYVGVKVNRIKKRLFAMLNESNHE